MNRKVNLFIMQKNDGANRPQPGFAGEFMLRSNTGMSERYAAHRGRQLIVTFAKESEPLAMIVYVDVDDTLVRTVGTTRIPMVAVIEHVRRLKADGAELYLWSAGGADYCRQTAAELGISDCFVAFLPKPRIMIDDQEVREWVFCTTFHPSTCSGRSLGDYLLS